MGDLEGICAQIEGPALRFASAHSLNREHRYAVLLFHDFPAEAHELETTDALGLLRVRGRELRGEVATAAEAPLTLGNGVLVAIGG